MRLERRPGPEGGAVRAAARRRHATEPAQAGAGRGPPATGGLEARVARLEEQIAELLEALDVGDGSSAGPEDGAVERPEERD